MKKYLLICLSLFLFSCSQKDKKSIILGVEQTVNIPVNYVSVSANIQLEESDAATAEVNGYERLAQAVGLLEGNGFRRDQLEIQSGEIRNRTYRNEPSYQYNASIKFDIPDLDKIDSIRRSLINQGVNNFSINAYKNSKEDSLYNIAYQQAIQKAKEKAQVLVDGQQLTIGEVLNIRENVEETFEIVSTPQSAIIDLDAELAMESLDPLFNKEFYKKRIEFTIEFALE